MIRFGYDNILRNGTLTPGGGEEIEHPVANAVDWLTWTKWKPITPATVHTLEVELNSPAPADYIAVFGIDDFTEYAGSIKLEASANGTDWDEIMPATALPDTRALWQVFPEVSYLFWRITFETTNAGNTPSIGVVSLGKSFQVGQKVPVGFIPPWYDDALSTVPIAMGGTYLGRASDPRPRDVSFKVDFIETEDARTLWVPFIKHAKDLPFFFLWDEDIPGDVVYSFMERVPDLTYSKAVWLDINLGIKCVVHYKP